MKQCLYCQADRFAVLWCIAATIRFAIAADIRNGGGAVLCFRCHHNPAGHSVVIFQFTPSVTTTEDGIVARTSISDVNHQWWDWFSVGLLLRNRETVPVFTFIGDGDTGKDRDVGWLPVWLKRIASSNNVHVTSSREFAEELSRQIAVPVTPSNQTGPLQKPIFMTIAFDPGK